MRAVGIHGNREGEQGGDSDFFEEVTCELRLKDRKGWGEERSRGE